MARGIRLEAKAVGLLQVIAIAFAVLTQALGERNLVVRGAALAALLFLTAATWGALEALRMRPRRQVLARTALSESGGMGERAAAAEQLEVLQLHSSNFLAGVTRDLAVGGTLALVALALMGFGL